MQSWQRNGMIHNRRCCISPTILPYAAIASAVMTTVFLLDTGWTNAWPFVGRVHHHRSSRVTFVRRHTTTLCSNFPFNRSEKSDVINQPRNDIRCGVSNEQRTRQTSVDDEFRKTATLPEPSQRHIVLPISDPLDETKRSGILVIGDVHGCYDEMMLLYEKAVAENDHQLFEYVILVGDVCNKGPQSMAVIRHVRRNYPRWMSIRGNHEHSVLKAALELSDVSLMQSRYSWLVVGDKNSDCGTVTQFSDEDVVWMANLPYTIRIPSHVLGDEFDTIIVHAGLIPGVCLEQTDPQTFILLRDLELVTVTRKDEQREPSDDSVRTAPWASLWKGPEQVIFGHDAKRGLQEYEYATGLDTGCVYGKKLTGIILPQRKIVQVNARKPYVPIKEK